MKKLIILTAISLISCRQYDLQLEKIKYYARKHQIQEHLALGLVKEESQFNSNARGSVGEIGLTQVYPKYHRERCKLVADSDLLDDDINLDCGFSYLRKLYVESGSITEALAKYNGGSRGHHKPVCIAYAHRVLKHSKEYL
jgi:soluble lytic murein transglycosylase-like protein